MATVSGTGTVGGDARAVGSTTEAVAGGDARAVGSTTEAVAGGPRSGRGRRSGRSPRGRLRCSRERSLALRALAVHADALPPDLRQAVVKAAHITSTGVVVVLLGELTGPPSVVVKVPRSTGASRALERETVMLTGLRAQPGLSSWRDLAPKPYGHGTIDGQDYRVESFLLGHSVSDFRGLTAGRWSLVEAAAEAISELHSLTRDAVDVDKSGITQRWVGVHVAELRRHARGPGLGAALERLQSELEEGLSGRTFSAGWVHGDFWLGNVLFEHSRPMGIIDWETAASHELALHDLLHLLLYSRRLRTGRSLGLIVRDQLRYGTWSGSERRLLDRYGGSWRGGELSDRHALLLYWLRNVAMHARQQSRDGGLRYRMWERRNVLPVLAFL